MAFEFRRLGDQRADQTGVSELGITLALQLIAQLANMRAACNAAALVRNGQDTRVITGTNGPGLHAEEHVALQASALLHVAAIPILVMFVDIEPCYANRYAGHQCLDLFGNGRPVQGQVLRFIPGLVAGPTYVFYLHEQPAAGERANAQAWTRGDSLGERAHGIRNLFETPQNLIPLGRHP